MKDPIVFEASRTGRADAVVAAHFPGSSRRRIAALFREGAVRVNNRVARKGDAVSAGAKLQIARPPTTDADLIAIADDSVAIEVVHEDPRLVVLAKPAGVPSHPLRPGEAGCAANWLVARYPESSQVGDDPREAGLANRLDTGTSGLLLAARDADTWRALRKLLGSGAVDKQYLALVAGPLGTGSCEAPLAQRGKRAVVDYADGLDALTEWTTQERMGDYTLVSCTARTGRMHQLRAHLALMGAPLVGDPLYGGPEVDLVGHFLHAQRISFTHPHSGEKLELSCELSADRAAFLDQSRVTSSV